MSFQTVKVAKNRKHGLLVLTLTMNLGSVIKSFIFILLKAFYGIIIRRKDPHRSDKVRKAGAYGARSMRELLPIFIISMVLAGLSEMQSDYQMNPDGGRVCVRKDRLFFFIMAVLAAGFVGLRTRYNDTGGYRMVYENMDVSRSLFETVKFYDLSTSPGFVFVNYLLRHANVTTEGYIMTYALFDIGVILWFVRKHTNTITLSIFLVFATGVYTFCMAAIMQMTALAFCLLAVDRLLERKYLYFLIFIVLGIFFHTFCIVFLLASFMQEAPWTRNTYIMIIAVIIGIIFFKPLLTVVIDITNALGETYTVDGFTGEGVNVFRAAVSIVPAFLSFLVQGELQDSEDREKNLLVNLAILNGALMVLGLFGTANYFARMANYFCIFQVFALPILFECFDEHTERILKIGCVVGYLAYFYYSRGIMYGGFDRNFERITLGEFLKTGYFKH